MGRSMLGRELAEQVFEVAGRLSPSQHDIAARLLCRRQQVCPDMRTEGHNPAIVSGRCSEFLEIELWQFEVDDHHARGR